MLHIQNGIQCVLIYTSSLMILQIHCHLFLFWGCFIFPSEILAFLLIFLLQIWMPNCQTSKIYFLQQEEHIFRYTFKILNSYFAKALESSWQKRDACNKQRKAGTLPTQAHCKLLTHGRSCRSCLHRDHRFSSVILLFYVWNFMAMSCV